MLNRPNASPLPVTLIRACFNDTVYVKESIHVWLYHQHCQIALTIQRLSESLAIDLLEASQASLDEEVPHYQEVLQAFREMVPEAFQEMDPDYRLRRRLNWQQRNVRYHFVGGHLCPAVEPGTLSRDFGPFRVYEVQEHQYGVPLAPSSDVCLVLAEGEVLWLGKSDQSEIDSSALLTFVHSWMAAQEQTIHRIKGHVQTAADPKRRARLQRVLSRLESSLLSVARAVDELKRSNHAV
jgi:hypothetical protein